MGTVVGQGNALGAQHLPRSQIAAGDHDEDAAAYVWIVGALVYRELPLRAVAEAPVAAALIILVPIFLPVALEVGIEPIHFGVIVVVNLMIGLCTPPRDQESAQEGSGGSCSNSR